MALTSCRCFGLRARSCGFALLLDSAIAHLRLMDFAGLIGLPGAPAGASSLAHPIRERARASCRIFRSSGRN